MNVVPSSGFSQELIEGVMNSPISGIEALTVRSVVSYFFSTTPASKKSVRLVYVVYGKKIMIHVSRNKARLIERFVSEIRARNSNNENFYKRRT